MQAGGEPLTLAIDRLVRDHRLTPSERELVDVACTAGPETQREMAARLGLQVSTIARQRRDLLAKTGDRRLSHVVIRVLRAAYWIALEGARSPSSTPCPLGAALDAAGVERSP